MRRTDRRPAGPHHRRVPRHRGRFAMLLGAVLAAVLATTSVLAIAAVLSGGPGGLEQAGPANPATGFPDWYRDSKGVALEPCIDVHNPLCLGGPEQVAQPDQPLSFPGNFPDEFFYWVADAQLDTNGGGGSARLVLALEGAFVNGQPREGDQMVFGRVRFVAGGLQAGREYTITHPQGQDTVVAEASGPRGLFVTQDIGAGAQAFDEVLQSRIGPFLRWTDPTPADPAVAPAGYLGDPRVPHTVTGSPHGTNFFRITGPQAGGTPGATNTNPCPDTGPDAWTGPVNDCVQTDLFGLSAKLSTRGGVAVDTATYGRDVAGTGRTIDVLARSKSAQNLVVQDQDNGPARRFPATALKGGSGSRYVAHLDLETAPGAAAAPTIPSTVDVRNRSDVPETVRHMTLTDRVHVASATYHTDTDTLSVTAASSDRYDDGTGPAATLTLPQFADQALVAGSADVTGIDAPPATVRVASTQGGSATLAVEVTGPGLPPVPLAAAAGPDQSVEQTTLVKLDAGGSSGSIDSYHWTAPPGVTLSDPDSPAPTFTVTSLTPNTDSADLTLTLTLTGPGGPISDDVIVHVRPVTPPVATITVDPVELPDFPSVPQGLALTLDGTTSGGAAQFSWEYLRDVDPADGIDPELVAPGPLNDSKFTFTMPRTSRTLAFRLTVTNPQGDTSEALVALTPQPDSVLITRARYVPATARWNVMGTTTMLAGNEVTVHSGATVNTAVIGTAPVDALGLWSIDVTGSHVAPSPCDCVSVESSRGGETLAFSLEKGMSIIPPDDPILSAPLPAAPPAFAAPAPAVVRPAAATLAPITVAVPPALAATTARAVGVPVTITPPAGAVIAQVRVLTPGGTVLFLGYRTIKTQKKAFRLLLNSRKLRRSLHRGHRYVLEVRPGISRKHLGKVTRHEFTIGTR